ncbi:hypothetical protein PC128_g22403 [Phytophthora cactorum]|nr:hypothetical protein PC128_g22403 [Phytophthora cactorum]
MDEVDAVAVVCKTSENVVITTGETGESSPPSGAGLGGELGKDEAFVPTKDEKEAERNCGSEEAGSKIRKRGSIGDGDNRVADQDQGSKGGTTDHPQRRNGCVDGKGVLYLYERGKNCVKSGGRGQVQDVIEKQEDDVKASEKETTATEPEVSQNACVWLKNKDLEVPEKVGLEVDSSVSLQRRVVARKLPPLRDKDELEETAESGLRYYLKNEGFDRVKVYVRAKVQERRQRRGEVVEQWKGRALQTVSLQLPEESMFELYAAGDEAEAKAHCVYSISASGIPRLFRRPGLRKAEKTKESALSLMGSFF